MRLKQILALVLVLMLVMLVGCKKEAPAEEPAAVEEPEAAEPAEAAPAVPEEATPENIKGDCPIDTVIGFVGCSGNVAKIKNSGRADINGLWYQYMTADDKLVTENSLAKAIAVGETVEADLEFGEAVKVIVNPINADGMICQNQRVLIPATSCK